jgi:tubulin polyglutamylase TTLL6/13
MVYILKPDAGCQGRGIRLVRGGSEQAMQAAVAAMPTTNVVAQHYLDRPFTIHKRKFDLRVYALVLSVDPLRCRSW